MKKEREILWTKPLPENIQVDSTWRKLSKKEADELLSRAKIKPKAKVATTKGKKKL